MLTTSEEVVITRTPLLHTVTLEDFPIIDLEVVKMYISPEKVVFEPLLLDFLSSLEEHNKRLTLSFSEKNWPLFSAEAHQLNGSAGYFGAGQLLALCGQLQHLASDPDEQAIAPLFAQLQQAFENLQNYQIK